jgi:hypothetical protein
MDEELEQNAEIEGIRFDVLVERAVRRCSALFGCALWVTRRKRQLLRQRWIGLR